MFKWFAPAPHIARLPDDAVRRAYPRFRWQILESTFIGYATYYLVRNNLSVVSKDLQDVLHYDKAMLGNLAAVTALSYGVGKFAMGAWSDRSNPRTFMATGLLLTALCNFAFGAFADIADGATLYTAHFYLWALNGLVQGMGWPPCGRSMGHWFSERERGLTFSIWNTSHNVGGGIAGLLAGWAVSKSGGDWQYAFYFPGALALVGAFYLLFRLRDTPQSVGLPPIEEYRNDIVDPAIGEHVRERNLGYRELLIDNVFNHKIIWLLAFANFFAYIARYSMLDWGPMYLREVKGVSGFEGGKAIAWIEWAGIPSTIFFGWVTDRIKGRRGIVATFCMAPIVFAFAAMLYVPKDMVLLDKALLGMIGFFIYPVINLITIIALDVTSKKAIGTAAGFIGLMGYIGRTAQASGIGKLLDHYEKLYGQDTAWSIAIGCILASAIIATLLLALTWRLKPRA